ncbi:hypothetical protein CPT_Paso_037 [Rhizobium phage Paso]|uniref:Uncharacterized protein n=1 Tax=Rhizobium phage Paso TaxID=2767574 RepID=A0A7L8G4R4_9CAUD|nr:hypothetical protein CPT_Paso_037 [Rhizobium phage Paso]
MGSKPKQQKQILPAQAVSAQPVTASANVKSAVKRTDKNRDSGADIRSDIDPGTGGVVDPVTSLPDTGIIALGAKKKRKGIVGLDL